MAPPSSSQTAEGPLGSESRPRSSTATSASAASRHRYAHYGQQRSGPSSRPSSGQSQRAARQSGSRTSYAEPQDFDNLDEVLAPAPIQDPDEEDSYQRQPFLEDGRGDPAGHQRRSVGHSRRYSARRSQDQNLSELAAREPVQDHDEDQRSSASKVAQEKRHLDDAQREDADDDQGSSPTPPSFAQRRTQNPKPPTDGPPGVSHAMTELYTISYLIFFSILGTLARLGTQWLTWYPGAPVVTPVLWANFGGSILMGYLSEDQRLFRDHWATPVPNSSTRQNEKKPTKTPDKAETGKRKKAIPLFIGLATGFCGSYTSFSSFARDVFLALSNNLPTPVNHPYPPAVQLSTTSTAHRNGGYSFLALVGIVLITITLSLGGLMFGAHAALALQSFSPRISIRFTRRVLDPLGVILGVGCWLGALFLAIWPPDRPGGPSSRGPWTNETWRGEVLFAITFAPLGCLLRFYVSLKLNGLVPAFPLGTFAVNMIGTAVEALCWDIQHVGVGIMGRAGGGRVGCQVLQGVQDGFCGCLTTVSTWVVELNSLRRRHGYLYGLGSVVGALCLTTIIMGSVRWSVGWTEPACNTGYTSKIH